jgi:hypothetical protein
VTAIEPHGPETRYQLTEISRMNIESMVYIWLGLALLFTLALCRAATGAIPKPGFPDKLQASGSSDDKPRSNTFTL